MIAHKPRHPVAIRLDAERAADLQLRIADHITAFAGSMTFVYVHVLVFGLWMVVFEAPPWPTLTLAVSLEAIFLSTFVMIGQNRQAAFQQAKADHDFVEEVQELKLNTELTREIRELTRELHERIVEPSDDEDRVRPGHSRRLDDTVGSVGSDDAGRGSRGAAVPGDREVGPTPS